MTNQPGERDNKGRFIPGNSGNPTGRPSRSVEEAALDKFRKHFNNGRFEDTLDALDELIRRRNVRAIELVYEYLLGKPTQRHEIDATVALPDALAVLSMVYKQDPPIDNKEG